MVQKVNKTITDAVSWYSEKKPIYEQLAKKIQSIVQEVINDENIPIHAIYCRAKEIDSFAKKIEDPKYTDPTNQVTDLSGIRIITYVESDLEKVSKVIEAYFQVDPENSINKSESLGEDKVGYRSIHYICQLPSDRIGLPEYKKFVGFRFEIQIRTILQHAWAEIEHDKNYKFSGELPIALKRRFKVLAGVLELADREFNSIAVEIDEYSVSVNTEAEHGRLEIPIDSTSIRSYLNIRFKKLIRKGLEPKFASEKTEKLVLQELRDFGITTLKQLDDIIPSNFVDKLSELNSGNTYRYARLLRIIMIVTDAERYFKDSWNSHWGTSDSEGIGIIKSYNVDIDKFIEEHDLQIIDM